LNVGILPESGIPKLRVSSKGARGLARLNLERRLRDLASVLRDVMPLIFETKCFTSR
jgi:hypothetical protein